MRRRGTIRTWNDGEGYGFILPEQGGNDVFVHITAFGNRRKGRRPVEGEEVTFEPATDDRGRARAENAAFPGESVVTRALGRRGTFPIAAGLLDLGCVAVAWALG